MQSKLRNSYPEHSWLNAMKNFKSNRIKNLILLAICVSDIGMMGALVHFRLNNCVENDGFMIGENMSTEVDNFELIGFGLFQYRFYSTLAFQHIWQHPLTVF